MVILKVQAVESYFVEGNTEPVRIKLALFLLNSKLNN